MFTSLVAYPQARFGIFPRFSPGRLCTQCHVHVHQKHCKFYMQFTHPRHLLHINYTKWELRYLVWIDKNKYAHIMQGLVGQLSRSCKPQRLVWIGDVSPMTMASSSYENSEHVYATWLPMGLQNTCSCCTHDNFWWSNITASANNGYR